MVYRELFDEECGKKFPIFSKRFAPLQPHHLPDDPVGHLYRADQDEHVKDHLPDIAPHHRYGCGIGLDGGRRCGKVGEDDAREHNDCAFQTHGSVAFEKASPHVLARLPGKG